MQIDHKWLATLFGELSLDEEHDWKNEEKLLWDRLEELPGVGQEEEISQELLESYRVYWQNRRANL